MPNTLKLPADFDAYAREQRVLLRLLKRCGSFTADEFDRWFHLREWRRPVRFPRLYGDTPILGCHRGGISYWALMLELLQLLVAFGWVESYARNDGLVYHLKTPHDRTT